MRYLRDKEFRMSVLISACVAAITAAAGFFLIRQQAAMAGFLLAVLGCVLVIALWLAFTLRRYRRLEKLAADTDRMLHGERDLNFTQYREGELEILANELSKLLNRLSEQADHLQAEKVYLSDSLADISHQLRTPLTSLNLVLARLGDRVTLQCAVGRARRQNRRSVASSSTRPDSSRAASAGWWRLCLKSPGLTRVPRSLYRNR